MTKRITALVELAVGVAGLAVYLALLGGIQHWVKLEAAGLPGDGAMGGYDTRTLVASGTRALAVLPLAFCVLLLVERILNEDAPREKRNTVAKAIDRFEDFAFPTLVALGGIVFGLGAVVMISEYPLAPADSTFALRVLWLAIMTLLMIGSCLLIPGVLVAARSTWRKWKRWRVRHNTATGAALVRMPISRRSTEPPAFAWTRTLTSVLRRHWAWTIPAFIIYLAAAGLTLALALDHGDDAGGTALIYSALAFGSLPYVLLGLRLAAAFWRTATDIDQRGTIDDTTAFVAVAALAAYLLPLWAGAYVVSTLTLVFLAGQAPLAPVGESAANWLPSSLAMRVLIVSVVVAASGVAFQAHQPQRFPLAVFPINEHSLSANAALLGRADGQLLLAVCHRDRNGTSSRPELLRVSTEHLPAYRVVADGYTFYRERESSLVSGLLKSLDLPAYRPPALNVALGDPGPSSVCGPTGDAPEWVFDQLRRYRAPG